MSLFFWLDHQGRNCQIFSLLIWSKRFFPKGVLKLQLCAGTNMYSLLRQWRSRFVVILFKWFVVIQGFLFSVLERITTNHFSRITTNLERHWWSRLYVVNGVNKLNTIFDYCLYLSYKTMEVPLQIFCFNMSNRLEY